MIKKFINKGLPHIVIITFFVVLAVVYFAPAVFQNKELAQGDVKSSQMWGKDLRDYHEKTGEYAFWSDRMFGGMPANYTYMPPFFNIFSKVGKWVRLDLPFLHVGIVFLYLLGFYIFLLSLGCKTWLSLIGALAYAFASYNIIIIDAGHVNKGYVMATMAPVLGGIILCYRKKYLWGAIVTLVFTGLNIHWGHQQITYYLLLIIFILAIVYLVYAIRNHTLKDYFRSSLLLAVIALLAIAPAAGPLLSTADYTKETMRGGAVLQNNAQGEKENSGLDINYAFAWSYGKGETMTLLIPGLYGASSHYNIGRDSETYRLLRSSGQAEQFTKYAPMYWGDQPFTAGPVYAGAVICFLFVLGLFILKGPEKWWLLMATILSIVLSWGRNFSVFNDFLFYHLPLYNKFRVPAMALVIADLTMVAMAVLALKELIKNKGNVQQYLRQLYMSAGITGGLCLLLALFGGGLMDFSSPSDAAYRNYPQLVEALRADRQHLLALDAWRSFFFIVAAAGVLWFYLKKSLTEKRLFWFIGVLVFWDLWMVDKRFLNTDTFISKSAVQVVEPTAADRLILQDKDPSYRVLNLSTNTFNESTTSYFHRSIGGYSPAKLRRYQDIIDYYFAKEINMNVLNMLNTRYIIIPSQQGPQVQKNEQALGNVWFVDELNWVDSPDEEIRLLKDFDPAKTAVVDKVWKERWDAWETLQPVRDTTDFIRLKEHVNPGELVYESKSNLSHLSVFSEVFYKTWKAYIDGKETPLIRVNYILRALPVPAGEHRIEFKCVDEVYQRGTRISLIASVLAGIVLLGLLGMAGWKGYKLYANGK
ncbi:MAG: YfhO family protein [Oscillibacter sp.]|nr:YfhO family protein [Oscillibacter sp.]